MGRVRTMVAERANGNGSNWGKQRCRRCIQLFFFFFFWRVDASWRYVHKLLCPRGQGLGYLLFLLLLPFVVLLLLLLLLVILMLLLLLLLFMMLMLLLLLNVACCTRPNETRSKGKADAASLPGFGLN